MIGKRPQRRRPSLRKLSVANYHVEALERRTLLSAFYDLSLITSTGEQTTTGDTINDILPFISINDSGKAAYVADVSGAPGTGTALIVDSVGAVPIKISFPNPTTDTAFAFPQINNAGLVAVRDRFTGTSPASSFIRTWNSAQPGTYDIVAASGDGIYDSVTLPTLTNAGGVGFIGFTNGSSNSGVNFNESRLRLVAYSYCMIRPRSSITWR